MTSMKLIAVFTVVLSAFCLQGSSGDRGGSEHGGAHTIDKRSISLSGVLPWLQGHLPFVSKSAAPESDDSLKQSDGSQGRAAALAEEPHAVSKRSINEIKPALEEDHSVLRSMPASGDRKKVMARLNNPVAAEQTILILKRKVSSVLKSMNPTEETEDAPCTCVNKMPPTEVPAAHAAPVVADREATPSSPAAPVVPWVKISVGDEPALTAPPKVVAEDEIIVVKPELPPMKPLVVRDLEARKAIELQSSAKTQEQARNDPISISNDLSIS